MAVLFFLLVGCFFLFTQYFQLVAGYGPLAAGIGLFPLAVVLMAVSPIKPRLTRRFGARSLVVAGLLCIAVGLIVFQGLDIDSPYVRAFVGLVFLAAGQGLAVPVVTTLIMSAVPSRRAGAGSAMNNTTRELGAALGVAVLGSTLNSRYVGRIDDLTSALSPADRTRAGVSLASALDVSSRLPREAQDRLVLGAKQAFISGLHLAMSVGIAIALSTAMAFVLFRSPKRVINESTDDSR
jgi:Na+/melibiose symporter-like transporter